MRPLSREFRPETEISFKRLNTAKGYQSVLEMGFNLFVFLSLQKVVNVNYTKELKFLCLSAMVCLFVFLSRQDGMR